MEELKFSSGPLNKLNPIATNNELKSSYLLKIFQKAKSNPDLSVSNTDKPRPIVSATMNHP